MVLEYQCIVLAVSVLYVLSPKFTISPAYFEHTGNTQEEMFKNEILVFLFVADCYTAGIFQQTYYYYYFPSIIYNDEYLNRKLPKNLMFFYPFSILFILK